MEAHELFVASRSPPAGAGEQDRLGLGWRTHHLKLYTAGAAGVPGRRCPTG